MSLELGFHDEALAEIRSAAGWYDEKRRGLGDEFLEALDVRLKQLAVLPNLGTRFSGADPKSAIHRILLARFPYVIGFLDVEVAIRVIAVMQGRQRPGLARHDAC